jgi:hypothetical protein
LSVFERQPLKGRVVMGQTIVLLGLSYQRPLR